MLTGLSFSSFPLDKSELPFHKVIIYVMLEILHYENRHHYGTVLKKMWSLDFLHKISRQQVQTTKFVNFPAGKFDRFIQAFCFLYCSTVMILTVLSDKSLILRECCSILEITYLVVTQNI